MNQTKAKAAQTRLRFSPTAWAKLLYLRDLRDSEVGGFGVTPTDDLLFVEEIILLKQVCSVASVIFDDAAVADFFELQVDRDLRPEQFSRIWIHTHPGQSPRPSGTDEATFDRVFGECDWAVMFILAEGGQTYARLGFHTGPRGALEIPVEVDFGPPFAAIDHEAWEQEYLASVTIDELLFTSAMASPKFALAPYQQHPTSDAAWDKWWDAEPRHRREEAMNYE